MSVKSICVFCGSRPGDNPAFTATAEAMGSGIAARGWRLVYGAGDVGLMGSVARSAQAAGGDTFGVIPQHLVDWEVGKTDLTTYIVTETMHERKKVMVMNSDAFVVLPGGAGSLDELFEVLTWRQLGLHEKPIYIVNTDRYWTPLMQLMKNITGRGFADESLLEFVTWVEDAESALEGLATTLSASFTQS